MNYTPPSADDAEALAALDRAVALAEQLEAELDQSYSDADMDLSEIDQVASNRDQAAADRDELALDEASVDETAGYEQSRQDRARGTAERGLTTRTRSDISRLRDEAAARRDRLAAERDAAARERDRLADALDAELSRLEQEFGVGAPDAAGGPHAPDPRAPTAARRRAALLREAAAADRAAAAEDRRLAGVDRAEAAAELAEEDLDDLTGALRRGVGLAAVRRELDRARRTSEPLVVAFVDVDGLKRVNDAHGHAAGDELLAAVADAIRQQLRSYDLIARVGGDEFLCCLSNQNFAGARVRFDEIKARLDTGAHNATISVGLAERQRDESIEALVRRADEAMMEVKRDGGGGR